MYNYYVASLPPIVVGNVIRRSTVFEPNEPSIFCELWSYRQGSFAGGIGARPVVLNRSRAGTHLSIAHVPNTDAKRP